MDRRYCLITPCRNEQEYARRTLESVVNQSIPPALWVIVDDGSTDSTPQILDEYANRHSFIRVVTRPDRGVRKVGPGVIEAFYDGYATINPRDFDYVCKFDLDLEMPPRYFEILMERMAQQPRLGTCSGKPYFPHPDTGKLVSEMCGDEMSVGMTKFYRLQCFEEIGGFVHEVMWDGIDSHTCRMKGWLACSWDDAELRFIHLRPMGSSHKGIVTGRQRHGFGQYFMGTWFPYMVASAVFRMTRPPIIVGGLAMLWGYVASWAKGLPRYGNAEFVQFLRAYQKRCLLIGKARATAEIDQEILKAYSAVTAPHSEPPVVGIEGLPFAALRMREVVNLIIRRHSEGCGGWVVTPNMDILRRWMMDASFRALVSGGETIFTADGAPIIWLSRILGAPLPERVSGSDLFVELAAEAAIHGKSIYLLGGNPGVAEIAAGILTSKYPTLRIAGCHAPPFGFERDPDELERIRGLLLAARPDIIFLGLPSPKQERLIASLRELLPSSWWLGVGVSFSFVAGDVKRAPVWVRKMGMEWFHRFLHEPKRLFRRYFIVDIPFAFGLFARNLVRRRRLRPARGKVAAKSLPP